MLYMLLIFADVVYAVVGFRIREEKNNYYRLERALAIIHMTGETPQVH
jgi:hypothetical protein